MTRQDGAVHVARVVRKYQTKDGEDRQSVSHLLRRSFRDGGKIRHETLGNVSALPAAALEALRAALAGETLVVAGTGLELTRALSHGHLAAVSVMAKTLGLRELLGPPCKERDIAYALILARVVHPRPKLATTKWWGDTTLVADLDLDGVSHRRGLRGHGLAGGTSRRHRGQTGHAPSRRRGQSLSSGLLRPVVFVGGRDQERAGGPGLLA